MDDNFGGLQTPSTYKLSKREVILLILFTLLIVFTIAIYNYGWPTKQTTEPTAEPTETNQAILETQGFNNTSTTADANATPTGHIVYTSPVILTQDSNQPSYTYTYDLTTGTARTIIDQPTRDYSPIDVKRTGVIAPRDTNNTNQSWQPHVYDIDKQKLTEVANIAGFLTNDLTYSPDDSLYAYSYRTDNNDLDNLGYIDNWKIAVHNTKTNELITIDRAAEPTWINDGADLLYTSPDGIFRYNLKTKTAVNVFSNYLPLSFSDDMAVSPDGKQVILTIPFIRDKHAIILFSFSNDDSVNGILTEKARIVSGDIIYTHPVFSPEGKFYAVAATVTDTDAVSRDSIEIRTLEAAEPVNTLPLPISTHREIALEAWISK